VTTCSTANLDEHAASCHMSIFHCQNKSSILEDSNFDNHHQMNSKSHINVMSNCNTVTVQTTQRQQRRHFPSRISSNTNLDYMGQ